MAHTLSSKKRIFNFRNLLKIFIIISLFFLLAGFQYFYDRNKLKHPVASSPVFSPQAFKMVDMGFHSAIASLLWTDAISDIVTLSDKNKKYLSELEFINYLDPKFSAPYSFSVLVMPGIKRFSNKLDEAIKIGKRGIESADSDWRIPFYLAVIYHIDFKDRINAAFYFDLASRTKGVPYPIKRFSINYGIKKSDREEMRQIWTAIYESSKDDFTRERAKLYITRLEILDFFDKAVLVYRDRHNRYPKNLNELVADGIIKTIPKDPYGFLFVIGENGSVGINKDDLISENPER